MTRRALVMAAYAALTIAVGFGAVVTTVTTSPNGQLAIGLAALNDPDRPLTEKCRIIARLEPLLPADLRQHAEPVLAACARHYGEPIQAPLKGALYGATRPANGGRS
jgi:hypothetical protein